MGPAGSQTHMISIHTLKYVLQNSECVVLQPSQGFSKGQLATQTHPVLGRGDLESRGTIRPTQS